MAHGPAPDTSEIITSLDRFDRRSGSMLERLLFNNRPIIVAICVVLTALLGWQTSMLRVNASFERMIPTDHPYVQNFNRHAQDLRQQGNAIRIIVAPHEGTIFTKTYLDALRQLDEEIARVPGVDTGHMSSLWSPDTRWTAVTPDGFAGGSVIPEDYDGMRASLDQVQHNIVLSGQIGRMVASDMRSTVIYVPLNEYVDAAGHELDYGATARALDRIRVRYASRGIDLRVTGFAEVVGDMINATTRMMLFFLGAIVITGLFLFLYTRCIRSTLLVILCSLIAVVWQLGIVTALGHDLDPYSILVPFLLFAIGMSHGAQKMNGIMQDVGRGMPKFVAARMTFRRLFMAGFSALVCDAVGFIVLYMIRIQSIRELAVIASLGVAILIFTNLILLPILLSYIGVSAKAAARSLAAEAHAERGNHWLWEFLSGFTQRRQAIVAIVCAVLLGAGGLLVRQHLAIGDLDRGAPELRANSRYNIDEAYLTSHYATSSDVMVLMAEMQPSKCNDYRVMRSIDTLEWGTQMLPGVESTNSISSAARFLITAANEQNFKWYELIANQSTLNDIAQMGALSLTNSSCSLDPIYIYLHDHKAQTLTGVTDGLKRLIVASKDPSVTFRLAAGTAGIDAATNEVVHDAVHRMLYWVYGAVIIICLIAFRSVRAVICAVLPLMLTSVLAEAMMVTLGIGVKVATLPVVALGVGIGVDYALYVLSIMLALLRTGADLRTAYRRALMFTGKVVLLTGFTLATAVATWAFAPIKFQADMGILLAFMFLWNMLGTLVLLPALAHFLLRPRLT